MSDQQAEEPPATRGLTRRQVLQLYTAAVLAAGGSVAAAQFLGPDAAADRVGPRSPQVIAAERARPRTGRVVRRTLSAAPTDLDLAGMPAKTWGFDGSVPAREIRVTAGDVLQVRAENRLPAPTTIHWHGVALRNDMDGVPGVTMAPIRSGGRFEYHFTVPDPGTYWFHPHVGVQLDTGLMGPLVVEDPHEPLSYDEDVTLVLDDWTDGVGRAPEAILARLRAHGMPGRMGGMAGMNGGGMNGMGGHGQAGGMGGMRGDAMSGNHRMRGVTKADPLGPDAGDVDYPMHLINGRPTQDPTVVRAKPGARIRLRLINAASDTAYRFTVGGHRPTVVHADGYPVHATEADTLVIGMGERYDVVITARDGAFPLVAAPVGKQGRPAFAILRTAAGSTPRPTAPERHGKLLTYADLAPTDAVTLDPHPPDRTLDVTLSMRNGGRQWLINGRAYPDHTPLDLRAGERVRLKVRNASMMFHPMHLHGHTFALVQGGRPGLRKDTLNVLPMQRLSLDLQASNPGQWLLHCHNAYHGELGMMTVLSYIR